MRAPEITIQDINKIVEIARLSPSVHNIQPWKVEFDSDSISILIDKTYTLTHGDPTGRQTFISLGIFSEAVLLASQAVGFKVKKVEINKERAKLTLARARGVSAKNEQILSLRNRCSDRSIYRPIDVSRANIREIESSSPLEKVKIKVVTNQEVIRSTAELTAKGIGLALTNPSFRKELSRYLILPWSGKKRGIPVSTLRIPTVLAILEPWLIKHGLGLRSEARLERKRWLSASALVFIMTDGDVFKDWFSAGRAYLRASLNIEQLGFSQATSAAVVEASTFHEDIESLLSTEQRLQCVIRIGKGSQKKIYSPRVSAEALLVT